MGLVGIEPYLSKCQMRLLPYKSGFTGQIILKTPPEATEYEIAMDPSLSDFMFASGYIFKKEEKAWLLIRSLSEVLSSAGFPHQAMIDDREGYLFDELSWKWPVSG